ncbi:uncharacterized protein LOC119180931 isoform X1 [Rhipicephalus microplus]|uniref:uncharacterized protein LOC119180931 isoform X1 n=1 Tax=Rhipicephalus microplus TaxID=6941 RepID=UPI003F6C651B
METGVSRYSSVPECDAPNISLLSEEADRCDGSGEVNDDCWQQLEAFWGAEKHRCCQQHEPATFESNSTESQLENRDFLSEPPPQESFEEPLARKATKGNQTAAASDFLYIVRGEDINDVPTSYVVNGIKPHEFPVIGTYVDKRVVPGFRYIVRVNRTSRFLFGGRPLHLESVGRGYGKRITFEAPPGGLNENDNFFYSDTIAQGYGFAPVAVQVGDRFRVQDSEGEECGDLVLDELLGEQTEVSCDVRKEDGAIVKDIVVEFHARFLCVNNRLLDRQLVWNKVQLNANARLVKARGATRARLENLLLRDCPLAGYELVPFSGKRQRLVDREE